MNVYFADEVWGETAALMTAGVKAREDFRDICLSMGYSQLPVPMEDMQRAHTSVFGKMQGHLRAKKSWDKSFAGLSDGDVVIIQFPLVAHTILFGDAMRRAQARGVRIALFIHDLESIRAALRADYSRAKQARLDREERWPLKLCDAVVVHNEAMKEFVVGEFGLDVNKIVVLGIFDYLLKGDCADPGQFSLDRPVVITGTLRPHKARYAYHLPDNISFNLYGVGYEGEQSSHITYHGAFPPDELPRTIHGSFGLVWDGDVAETCSGVYGEYLRINNPHKTSFYLACGMPVAIWEEAALAPFVLSHGVGIVVSSIAALNDRISSINQHEYGLMKENAMNLSVLLHDGHFTKRAIGKAIAIIN